jgi:hypothetical protein
MLDDTCVEKLLKTIISLILLGKGMPIWMNIGRKNAQN